MFRAPSGAACASSESGSSTARIADVCPVDGLKLLRVRGSHACHAVSARFSDRRVRRNSKNETVGGLRERENQANFMNNI